MKLSDEAKHYLTKTAASILLAPEAFDMGNWDMAVERPTCNTAMCIGGWIGEHMTRDGKNPRHRHSSVLATQLLAGKDWSTDADHLWYDHRWPYEFRLPYRAAAELRDYQRMAWVAVLRIARFIETDGAE